MSRALPPHVYRHDAAGFVGYRVEFKRLGIQRYFSRTGGGDAKARAAAIAFAAETAKSNPARAAAGSPRRYVQSAPVRGQTGVRGVHLDRDGVTYVARWNDPPQRGRQVRCGTGRCGLAEAAALRADAEALILAGRSTRPLWQRSHDEYDSYKD